MPFPFFINFLSKETSLKSVYLMLMFPSFEITFVYFAQAEAAWQAEAEAEAAWKGWIPIICIIATVILIVIVCCASR